MNGMHDVTRIIITLYYTFLLRSIELHTSVCDKVFVLNPIIIYWLDLSNELWFGFYRIYILFRISFKFENVYAS